MSPAQDLEFFLKQHVKLNPNRFEKLDKNQAVVTSYLKKHLPGYIGSAMQGSCAHDTVIKPVQKYNQFDADLQIYIRDSGFTPTPRKNQHINYVQRLHDCLQKNSNLKNKLKLKTRAVRVDYPGEFHLDLVPCVKHRIKNEYRFYVCNSKMRYYERTDDDRYKAWYARQDKTLGNKNLIKVTQLLKYLRDHKNNFKVKSILLSTLLAASVKDDDSTKLRDLSVALHELSRRMNHHLQRHPKRPKVRNPAVKGKNFNRNWDQDSYSVFRKQFNIYYKTMHEAFTAKDTKTSIRLWQKLFGKQFVSLR